MAALGNYCRKLRAVGYKFPCACFLFSGPIDVQHGPFIFEKHICGLFRPAVTVHHQGHLLS